MEKAYMPAIVKTDFGNMAIMIPCVNRTTVDILDENDVQTTIEDSGDSALDITFRHGYYTYNMAWKDNGIFDYIAESIQNS